MELRRNVSKLTRLMLLLGIGCGVVQTDSVAHARKKPKPPKVDFELTILHNNDGESALLETAPGIGGVARFATLVQQLKQQATMRPGGHNRASDGAASTSRSNQRGDGRDKDEHDRGRHGRGGDDDDGHGHGGDDDDDVQRGVVMLSSGDNFLAGPQFNASLRNGIPFYDSIALDLIGYDAFAIGNHEFDFGPEVLADFIAGFSKSNRFVSANLDFRLEPALQQYVDSGRIVSSTVVKERGEKIGIVGATTPALRSISSPRDVIVRTNVAQLVQAEVDSLRRQGINKIILISHLQSILEDQMLLPMLSGIDVAIAGGGDELLANPDDVLIPGDSAAGPYPLLVSDARGIPVPVVTTSGSYEYVGRLVVSFDKQGEILLIDDISGPVRVYADDGIANDPLIEDLVTIPVQTTVMELDATLIGSSQVTLDGRRVNVRSIETNEGNLIADAHFATATNLASDFGVPAPDVALQNGGGIRNDSLLPPGDLTELDTFAILPFANFICVVPEVPRTQFKEIMENAVSRVEFGDGRFAQISGFTMAWDPAGTPQILDSNGNVTTPGTRVVSITLDDGTAIVADGDVVAGIGLNVATIDFSARGGDMYPFRGLPFTTLGVTYQQSLRDYIANTLGGVVTAAEYPEGGEGRIIRLP